MAGAAAAGIGTWTYNKVKNCEPKVVTEFRNALRIYIEAIHKGNMSVNKINSPKSALEELKKNKDYKKISIQLTTEELEVIAYAGIDTPPYESGQFVGSKRKITKRGSAALRKIGYETMRCIKTHPRPDDPVYQYVVKKETEGKAKRLLK